MFAVMVGIVLLCKKWVFSKIRINKYIPLAVAIIAFIVQFVLKPQNFVLQMVVTAIIIVSFFWFMDIQQTGGPKGIKEKKIVIKPKSKPNRVKK